MQKKSVLTDYKDIKMSIINKKEKADFSVWGKDKTKSDNTRRRACHTGQARGKIKKTESSAPDIVAWADRVIDSRNKENKRGRSALFRRMPIILILTLTMLIALVALFCIYK